MAQPSDCRLAVPGCFLPVIGDTILQQNVNTSNELCCIKCSVYQCNVNMGAPFRKKYLKSSVGLEKIKNSWFNAIIALNNRGGGIKD